jgi:hypothetical protein
MVVTKGRNFFMLIRIFTALVVLIAAPAAFAQSWEAALDDDGGYAYGYARAEGLPMAFACTVRSVQNRPLIEVDAHEEQPTAPYNMRIEFWGATIPETGADSRADMVLWADDTGYALPPVVRDEFYGYWSVELSMGDAIYRALSQTSRLVLAVGQDVVWDVPVAGLGPAIAQAQQHCAATLVATGNPAPAWFGPVAVAAPQSAAPPTPAGPSAAAGAFTVPQQVIGHANRLCEGVATIGGQAFQAGDIDGDGTPDVVLDWNHVMCPPPMGRGFCGAANCSIDVFMSSKGYLDPEQMLGIGPALAPQPDGRMGLMISGSFSMCGQNGENCARPWLWNGTTLTNR